MSGCAQRHTFLIPAWDEGEQTATHCLKQEHEPQLKSSSTTKLKTWTQISFIVSQSMRKYNAFYPPRITIIQKAAQNYYETAKN